MDKGAMLIGLGFSPTQSDIQDAVKKGIVKNCDVVHAIQILLQDDVDLTILLSIYVTRAQTEGWDISGIDNLVAVKTTKRKFLRTYVMYGVYIAERPDIHGHLKNIINEFLTTVSFSERVDFAKRHPEILTDEADALLKQMTLEAPRLEARILMIVRRSVNLSALRRNFQIPSSQHMSLDIAESMIDKGVIGALDRGESISSIAAFLGKMGQRYIAAVELLDLALEINPKDAIAWNDKGAYLNDYLGQPEEAIKCYEHAIQIDPSYADAWGNKGIALGHLSRYEEALSCFKKAARLNPGDPKHTQNIQVVIQVLKGG